MHADAKRPNIIFIITDDLGYGDLGCYGQEIVKTPNIDRLATKGVRFTQAYAGTAVCGPSRAVLMTGRHSGHNPLRGNTGGVPLPASEETLASLLQRAGYVCGGFGKWGLGDVETEGVPEKHGFHEFFGYYHQVHAHEYFPEYLWRSSRKVMLPANAGGHKGEYSHPRIVAEMRRFITKNSDRPFFCYAPWTLPHGRFELPEDDPAWLEYKDRPWSHEERVVAAMLTIIDRSVGEIMDDLERLGIAGRTLIFFTSDNGGSFRAARGPLRSNGPLRGGKNTMYEGGLRVPLIAYWSGKIQPKVSDRICYFGDILPTFAELVGLPIPSGLDGHSLATELLGPHSGLPLAPEHEYLYWECGGVYHYMYPVPMQAVRKGKWKGVIPAAGAPLELYDVECDMSEQNNLSEQYPEIVAELLSLIKASHVPPPRQEEPWRPEGVRYR